MSIELITDPIPLSRTGEGVIRVGGTRVTLDTLVAAFRDGMTPEGIVEQYPVLRLADVYSAVGYVLSHAEAIDAYLRDRQQVANAVRQENEARHSPVGVRDRLFGRRHKE
jgi:uncharacterized protein (DUF433 family)